MYKYFLRRKQFVNLFVYLVFLKGVIICPVLFQQQDRYELENSYPDYNTRQQTYRGNQYPPNPPQPYYNSDTDKEQQPIQAFSIKNQKTVRVGPFTIYNQRGESGDCIPKCFAEKGSRVCINYGMKHIFSSR